MLLAVDIGNTHIALGVHSGEAWQARWRVRTVPEKTGDEYGLLLRGLLAEAGLAQESLHQAVVASVVPSLTPVFRELGRKLAGRALVVGPGVKTGLDIRADHPSEVGADLVADAVAAYARFKGNCIVVDFGTATTFTCVVAPGALVGVAIAPGVGTAARSLAEHAAQLPQVPLVVPKAALGKNTLEAMQSGLVFGYVGLVRELIRRLGAELGGEPQVIATGAPHRRPEPLNPS